MPTWCNHEMVDLMCSFGFGVLCFALHHLFFPANLCLARLGHWLGLLHVPLSFLAMASSSVSSASCCRDAQLLGICQSEVWNHMFLESLNLEFVSIWAPLTFSIGKLQKVSSFTLHLEFCIIFQHLLLKPLGHAFQLRGVGIFMAQIRFVACLISLITLALSPASAGTNNAGNVDAGNHTNQPDCEHCACGPCHAVGECCPLYCCSWTKEYLRQFSLSSRQLLANFGDESSAWERLLRQQGNLQNSALSKSFAIGKVCMYSI